MGSKALATTALLLSLNLLLFFTSVSSVLVDSPPPLTAPTCSIDVKKLAVCSSLLAPVTSLVGLPGSSPSCCSVLGSLADDEAALCVCIAIDVNVLGIQVNATATVDLVLSNCGKTAPPGYKCAISP